MAGKPLAGGSSGAGGAESVAGEPAAPPPAPGRSQAALLRETLDHPLVIQARSLFDAAIRKVDQGRPRAAAVEPTPVEALVSGAGEPLPDDDTIDHAPDGDDVG